jgi:hypothetical protein
MMILRSAAASFAFRQFPQALVVNKRKTLHPLIFYNIDLVLDSPPDIRIVHGPENKLGNLRHSRG